MKEFVVCYTLEDDIKQERILKESDISKEEFIQELVEKIDKQRYILAKCDQGDYWINRSLIRYIRVHEKNCPNMDFIKR
ncbi:hypothetical protein ACFVSW_22845 [Neobacillus sp. NPDC058068]|uniref:hypothetical protein n=1 Tax=Neobacillus sp. NPDC058068 TaxID=3346325 RepID=UPI0036D7AB08